MPDTNPGDRGAAGQRLEDYWKRGPGAAKWIGTAHPWTNLYQHLRKHMPYEMAQARRLTVVRRCLRLSTRSSRWEQPSRQGLMAWSTSQRRQQLPPGWSTRIVPAIKRRDNGICQWPTDEGICGAAGRDVDHKVSPYDHRPEALWLLCGPHHDAKTKAESNAARVRIARPVERHPGLR